MKLHETIKNLYRSIIKPIFKLEVQTEDGKWNKVKSINITEKTEFYKVATNSHTLICTKNHIIIDENNNEIFAIESLNSNIKTSNGIETIISVDKLGIIDNAYDLTLDGDNLYYTNEILSHNCVVADEFGFVPNNIASKVFESIYPVISSSKKSQFIIVSTPNGADHKNLYYDIWCKANSKNHVSNGDGWKAFRFDWWDVPGRDDKWKADTIASIGETRFAQEFGNEFLASSTIQKLVPDDILERHKIKLSEAKALDKDFVFGKRHKIFNNEGTKFYEFTMWHEFNKDKTYLASGDVAEGVGSDNSVLYIWDVTDLSNIVQCAKFSQSNVTPIEFAFITNKILSLYNNPYYVCERNGIGSGYLDSLRVTYSYPNIVMEGKNGNVGVFCHVTTKSKACIWAREMMTTRGFGWTIYDNVLLDEFSTFCRKDNKGSHAVYQAMSQAHDDHVMAWIWACYILQPEIVESYFVCCETFISQQEKIYPKILMPHTEYLIGDIEKVFKDPLYKDFIEFKQEINNKLGRALDEEFNSDKHDEYLKFANAQKTTSRDPYFNDYDESESWNMPQKKSPTWAHMNNVANRPTFYFN